MKKELRKTGVIAFATLFMNLLFVNIALAQTITTGTISGSPFCSGAAVSVPYTITGTFTSGNIFTAQLSDASGSFASPVDIGTLLSTASGTINGTIPSITSAGGGYRIRVTSSTPAIVGTDNGIDITINETPIVSITGLDTLYNILDPAVTLTGDPSGGAFSGNGITGNQYDPALAGLGYDTVVYVYTSPQGCYDNDTAITRVIDYDLKAGAIEIPHSDNWCSANAAYTTIGASPDEQKGLAWNNGPNYNRWFKFQATTTQVKAEVKVGGAEGSMRYPFIAIWDSIGNEILSATYYSSTSDIHVQSDTLTIGEWYYISVDNSAGSGYRGTFTLCVDYEVDYDFYEGAIEVQHTNDWCSSDAEYTTFGATPDKFAASCWNTSPNYNRWFYFVATATEVTVTVDRGGTKGTLQRANVAIWEADGITEVACNLYVNNGDDVSVGYTNLTIGNTYYISVDNNYSGYRGTFTLCIDNESDYDYYEGAIEVPHTNDWCSADAAYTTIGATPDKFAASCWNTSPNYNRWFYFVATDPYVTVKVDRGGTMGTLQRANVAIWEADGTTEVSCNRYVNNGDDVSVGFTNLTVGNTYYISVDNNYSGYRGTFTLCVDNELDYDYYEGAIEVPHENDWCSADAAYTTIGATPDKFAASCWNTNPDYNRWFYFVATDTMVTVKVDRGGTKGTLQRANAAIWEADGNTELACNSYVYNGDDVSVGFNNLTIGNTYYISIDNNYSGYRGTFTLCVDNGLDYDFYEGAIEVPHLADWCSSDAEYTTIGATPDKFAGSCWNTNPDYNRWFYFVATTADVTVTVDRGGTKGTLQRANVAIWEEDGITEVACNQYVYNGDDVSVGFTNLTVGNTYYISVDNNYSGYRGTFTLCVKNTPDYDFYEGAIEVPHIEDWCSADAEYTTIGATPDKFAGSCWNTNPDYNRWFYFVATTAFVTVTVDRGGTKGSLQRANVAIWETDGTTQTACNRYVNNGDDVSVGFTNLTIGNTYYISVDNNYSGYRGTFTLCVENTADYDFYEGAIEVPHMEDWCSADAIYTTIGATPDKFAGSCWNTSPNYNRWFYFVATTPYVTVKVDRGGTKGTMQRTNLALWEADGTTQIACNRYINNGDDVSLGSVSLVVGNSYYISVDNNYSGYRGTFTLCVDDDVDYDFKEGAKLYDHRDSCSANAIYTTVNASPDRVAGSNWINGPNYNRWFKFQATTPETTAELKTGGVEGTLDYGLIAIFNEDDVELVSAQYVSSSSDVLVTADTMTIGNWYYIVVDNRAGSSYQGSFSLCITNPLYAETRGTNVSCNGLNDGEIYVYASGGTFTTYSYSWTYEGVPFGTDTSEITGLSPGLYEITVTDNGSGEFVVVSYEVTEEPPLALFLTSTFESCIGGADGTVTANPSGGTETTYLYEWYENNILIGDITQTITNKSEGWYKVIVTDEEAQTCSIMDSIEITVNPYLVWTGDVNTDWNESGNWPCNIIPDINRLVQIPDVPNKPILSSGAIGAVDSLIIDVGSSLTISGNTLQIGGTITNNGSFDATSGTIEMKGIVAQLIGANVFVTNTIENLIINNAAGVSLQGDLNVTEIVSATTGYLASDGYLTLISSASQTALIDGSGTGEVTGNVTMQRYLSSGFGYKYFSSPFQAATVNEFGDDMDLTASFPTFYKYNESLVSAGWESYVTTTNVLDPMSGYAINFGPNVAPNTVDVAGVVNNGTLSRTIYNSDNTYTQGFNLYGNPYPSPIDWDAASGWTKTNIDNALYYFRAGGADQYSGAYASYINGISSDGQATNVVPSMQAFFVHVSDGIYPVTGELGMNNLVRVNDLTHPFLKSNENSNNIFFRLVTNYSDNPESSDPMVVYFEKNATNEFDRDFDALKLLNTDHEITNIYSLLPCGKKLSINALPEMVDSIITIPLGLTTYNSGEISFSIKDFENLDFGIKIYLHDAAVGTNQNLLYNKEYKINLDAGEHIGRFSLRLLNDVPDLPEVDLSDSFYVYYSNGYMEANIGYLGETEGVLHVFDIAGRKLFTEKVLNSGHYKFNPNVSNGIYIVVLLSGNDVKTKKIIIKK